MKISGILVAAIIFTNLLHAQIFSEISASAGINFSRENINDSGGGVCIFDYNNDGFEDFFVPGGYGGSAGLFRNNGNGTFTEVFAQTLNASIYAYIDSLVTVSSIAGDIDNDGDRDLFITTGGYKYQFGVVKKPDVLLENLGNGTFADISASAGISALSYGESASMGDYNLDGFLDIYVSNYVRDMSFTFDSLGNPNAYVPDCYENNFYINNGNKTFTESATSLGVADAGCGLTGIFSDFDFDKDPDILLANDFGEYNSFPNALFRNNYPASGFSSIGAQSGFNRRMFGMGIAQGDYNEDGLMDYYVTNIGTNSLYMNNGNASFSDRALSLGVDLTWGLQDSLRKTTWGCNFFDYDNDTYLDLYVAAGYVNAFLPLTIIRDSSALFRNNGGGGFNNISVASGLASPIANRGSAIFDFDNDGDMDLLVNHTRMQIFSVLGLPQNFHLYRNNSNSNNNWLKIKLRGTRNNRDGYGTRLIVYFGNRKLIRELDGGSSHASLNSSILHFGLGNNTMLDSVEVHWPGGGVQTLYNVNSNQTLSIQEPLGLQLAVQSDIEEIILFPNPLNNSEKLRLRIKSKSDKALTVFVKDLLGREVASGKIEVSAGQQVFNFRELFPAFNVQNQLYIISIADEGKIIYSEKLLFNN
jgi:hypothetical protein